HLAAQAPDFELSITGCVELIFFGIQTKRVNMPVALDSLTGHGLFSFRRGRGNCRHVPEPQEAVVATASAAKEPRLLRMKQQAIDQAFVSLGGKRAAPPGLVPIP